MTPPPAGIRLRKTNFKIGKNVDFEKISVILVQPFDHLDMRKCGWPSRIYYYVTQGSKYNNF